MLITNCWENVETANASLSTDDKIIIKADRSRCRQLLENLIRNSVEHVGEEVSIHIGYLDGGFYVEIEQRYLASRAIPSFMGKVDPYIEHVVTTLLTSFLLPLKIKLH